MADMKKLAEALRMAEARGYKVSNPAQQQQAKKPMRQSMVEYGRQNPKKSQFVERMANYNLEQLADPMQPLPQNVSLEQLIADLGSLKYYADFSDEV